jgi:hypothetical protein
MQHSAESIFSSNRIELVREFESVFKTALAHESGDQGVLFNEKNQGSKISWDCPFNQVLNDNGQTILYVFLC